MTSKTRIAVLMGLYGLATALAPPLVVAEKGDWLVRGGATMVAPGSDNLRVDAGEGVTLTLEVDDATTFGFDVTYMMTENLGLDLLLAWPLTHDVKAKGSSGGVSVDLGKIAETDLLPPTVSLQWYFMPNATFSPYVGAGINWSIFSSEKLIDAEGAKLSLDDSFGYALQVGADWKFGEAWFVNFDIRYLDVDTDAEVTDDVGTEKLGTIEIDPFVYSIMLGRKF